jgi:hypothetical protein
VIAKKKKLRRPLKTRIIFEGAHVYVAVEDRMSGRCHVYTVYKLKRTGGKEPSIIGREIDLPFARRLIRQDARGAALNKELRC